MHNKMLDQQKQIHNIPENTDARENKPNFNETRNNDIDEFFSKEYQGGSYKKDGFQGTLLQNNKYQNSNLESDFRNMQINQNNFYQNQNQNFQNNNFNLHNHNNENNFNTNFKGNYRKEPLTCQNVPNFKENMYEPNDFKVESESNNMDHKYSNFSSYSNRYQGNRFDQSNSYNSNYRSRGNFSRGRGERGRGFRGGSRGFRGNRESGDREDIGDREIEEVYDNDWQQKFKEADDFFNNEFQFKETNKEKDNNFSRSGFQNQNNQGSQYGEISAYSLNTDYNNNSAYNKFGNKQFNNYNNNVKFNDENNESDRPFNSRGGRGFSRPYYKSGHRDFQEREFTGKRGNY